MAFNFEKLPYSLLSEPNAFVFYEDINIHLAVFASVEEEAGLIVGSNINKASFLPSSTIYKRFKIYCIKF